MSVTTAEPIPPRLASILRAARDVLPHPIGSTGYALPDMGEGTLVRLVPGMDDPGLSVRQNGGAGENYLFLMPQAKRYRLDVRLRKGARNNLIILGTDSQLHGTVDLRASDGVIVIGERARWPANLSIRLSSDRETFFLGRSSRCNGLGITIEGEGRAIIIGDECMFATDTQARTSDLHAVVSMETGARINLSKNVLIEPHVWLGEGAIVMKGAGIGFGSVIGARAVVTGEIPRFSAAAGCPARVTRENISWDSRLEPGDGLPERLRRACARLEDKERIPARSGAEAADPDRSSPSPEVR